MLYRIATSLTFLVEIRYFLGSAEHTAVSSDLVFASGDILGAYT